MSRFDSKRLQGSENISSLDTGEFSSCGVGFVASLNNEACHETLQLGLKALVNLEHRGGTSHDLLSSDGAGIMTDIPHSLLGVTPGDAVANLFLPRDPTTRLRSLRIFEETFNHIGLEVLSYREIPLNLKALSDSCQSRRPEMLMAIIKRPAYCGTRYNFEKLLYSAKQLTRSRLREAGILKQFFFVSLSAATIVYKALVRSSHLAELYLDLKEPSYQTRFALFHRRFSTNTATAWDTAQPFRVVAHNGEINTISGNRAWAYAREHAMGLREDELLTHRGISDSGSVNEIIEALMFRSSIPHPEDILAIMMPQANATQSFYKFWGRGMEPWDGPALFTYSDGRSVGARLDRSGFRPCRWTRTARYFFLSSEAGSFEVPESEILAKGSLSGGNSVRIELRKGAIDFKDASQIRENNGASFDPRLTRLHEVRLGDDYLPNLRKLSHFGYTDEDLEQLLFPMVREGKEAIGSMGDTARLAVLSQETRSVFNHFYQDFAQVTNPPIDYLRERMVTDMQVVLGRKPNIFEPKELLPLKPAIELSGPVISLAQMEFLKRLSSDTAFEGQWPATITLDTTYERNAGVDGFHKRLQEIKAEAGVAIKDRVSVFILSDRRVGEDRTSIPAIFALTALINGLANGGMRLRASIVVETAEVKTSHELSVLIGFGAAAVCPYLALEVARFHPALDNKLGTADARELDLRRALETGLLRILSKMGVSVLQSYQGAELFTILGFSKEVHSEFFPQHESRFNGLSLEQILDRWHQDTSATPRTPRDPKHGLPKNYFYKEHPKGLLGEKHSMTLSRSKLIHRLVAEGKGSLNSLSLYEAYLDSKQTTAPITFRHFLKSRTEASPLDLKEVDSVERILSTFGAGAMSFGAISAESQRDIFLAMKEIGGRSNSGEGGENPYYFVDGITASTKQIASGRFGVTAEYLVTGKEAQIKIAQGAKPGEGGQLMAVKVTPEIARARHSAPGVDLVSPPPMHDIYSIEDLKQLIYELRQLEPALKVSVKLVSGKNIGTIAVGVAKAGADIIHISGHDGGTGAAALSSMKHAGLPWEIGLAEVHRTLVEQGLRECVTLRVDGGLSSGEDVIQAALLGADEYDFGKLLLIAEGCIMARVCEKNTCPTGIATHDEKFKRLYRGSKEKVVALLTAIAEDVRRHLSGMGQASLSEIVGRSDLLELDPQQETSRKAVNLDFSFFLQPAAPIKGRLANPFREAVSSLNEKIVKEVEQGKTKLKYSIYPHDRAIPATLQGAIARASSKQRFSKLTIDSLSNLEIEFTGSAGQGFAIFLQPGITLRLRGEANDSVGKSMSGGKVILLPAEERSFFPSQSAILGNCALYGATGGTLFANGIAGNRFAVRNSGANAVVEGVGMHACEYMTGGKVVVLGEAGLNIGAGMTGGALYIFRDYLPNVNNQYLVPSEISPSELAELKSLLEDYHAETGSAVSRDLLENWEERWCSLAKLAPIKKAAQVGKLQEPSVNVVRPTISTESPPVSP